MAKFSTGSKEQPSDRHGFKNSVIVNGRTGKMMINIRAIPYLSRLQKGGSDRIAAGAKNTDR